MGFQLDVYQDFSSSRDSEELWQRLHTRLAQYGICDVFYAITDVPLLLNMDSSYEMVYVKTSYPDHLMASAKTGYTLEKDAGAMHCLTQVTPFFRNVNSRWVSAKEREQRLASEIFWYEESERVGVTIPLRFGSNGFGGISFRAEALSCEEFDECWGLHQHEIIAISYIFDEVARANFSDLLGIQLSQRERQVVSELAEGESAKRVAAKLGISTNTVSNQITSARKKLNAINNAHLISKAVALSLI